MNPIALGRRAPRTVFVRLALLVGVLVALAVAFGGQPFSLGRSQPIASSGGQGYWLLAKDGGVFGYGDAGHHGTNLNSGNDAIGLVPTPTLRGYWIADDDGTVVAYGDAGDYGSRVSNVDDVRGFAARPQGDGYWLVTRDGAVYAFGAAPYRGNTPALGANQKIVGMASTPSGDGYWLVGRDGGIFAFGDAAFYGSTGAITLNQPIVGMARNASGNGYWFVASDGGVFAFGGAGYRGAAVGSAPAGGITGMTPAPSGNGYWLVGANGKVFPYGDAVNYGDAAGLSLRQSVVGITATPVVHTNTVPAPVNDSASVAEDGSASINVMANDAGLNDGPIAIALVSGPAHGSASITGDKKISYVPSANYHGPDSITYKLTDADGESATAVLSLTVTPVNDAPVVQNRTLSTSEDTVAGGTFSGSDVDGNSLTYSVTQPAHGSVTASGSSFTYTPAANYNGADSFTFRANDGSANSNTGTVSVTVTAVADAPVATNMLVSTAEDTPLSGAPSGVDADGDVLSFDIVTPPAHGDLSGSEGSWSYTPDADFNGTDSLTYTATDGTLTSAPATVTITVTPVNDAPVAAGGSGGTNEDTALIGTLAATDVDGDSITYSISTDPQHGTVTVDGDGYTYTPAANVHGDDSFAFVANDGTVDSAPAAVAINVTSIEDAPIFDEGNGPGSGTGGFIDIAATGTELDNHGDDLDTTVALPFPVSFYGTAYSGDVLVSGNGWISFDNTDWSYSNGPLSEVGSPAAFLFWDDLRTDGEGHGIWTEVRGDAPNRKWIVQWNVTHYGTGGATVRFEAIFTEGSPVVEFHYNDVLFGHSADKGAEATVGVVKDGTTHSQFSFDQPSLSNGLFLSYDTSTNLSSVGSDNETVTDEDTALELDVTATDGDGDVLTYAISGAAGHGLATINPANGHVTYTPAENYNGDDTFTVSVTDGHSAPVTTDVTVTVSPVNDPPVIDQAGPLAVAVDEDSVNGVNVAVTAADIDAGDSQTWSASDPDHGTVTGGGPTGDFTYVPDADFDGTESFTITVEDGDGDTDTIGVNVTITNLNNDAPVVSSIGSQPMAEDGTLEIGFSATDPDTGDVLAVTVGSSDPTLLPAGSLTLGGTGTERTITVHPAANAYGSAHLFLMVSDGEAAPQLQDILLTVNAVNDLPVANAGSLTTAEDTPGISSLTGDDPVEHSALTFSLVGENGGAEHGTVTITNSATGAYSYTPDADFNGPDSFSFLVNDGSDDSPLPATISVTVSPEPDAPAFDGTGNSGTGDEGSTITGTVHATDADTGDTLTYSIEPGDDAALGTASVNGETGEWSYTGDDDFAGPDGFTVTVTDGDGLTDTIVVNVTVGNLNDAPAFATASVDAAGNEDTAITGTVTALDPDAGDTLAYRIDDGNGAGDGTASVDEATGAWSYTGDQDFNGSDSFTITVTDGEGETDTIVVNVTVDPVNDAPAFDGTGNSGSGNEDSAITGAVHATDVDGDGRAYSIESGHEPGNGTATVNGIGEWSYTGTLNSFGVDSFTITVNDGHGGTDTIEVNVAIANVNDAPVVSTIGNLTTDEDTPLVGVGFTVSDADPADSLTVTVGSSNPTLLPAGALSLGGSGTNRTLTITPAPNMNGTAQVFLSVSDGHAAPVIQTIHLTVTPDNDAPTADAASSGSTFNYDNPLFGAPGQVMASDIDGDALTYTLVTPPADGDVVSLDSATGQYLYTTSSSDVTDDTFDVEVSDGLDSVTVVVTIHRGHLGL